MNPAFTPPPDYTRREAQATLAGGCPFYGAAIHCGLLVGIGGNRCALITSARSPCWMEVAEWRPPEWAACPRNPDFIAAAYVADDETARLARERGHEALRHLAMAVAGRKVLPSV